MLEHLRSRLQYKLMLVFSLVILVALTTSGLYSQLSARGLLTARARDDQLRLVASRVAAAEGLLAEIRTDLLFLTRDAALARGLRGGEAGVGRANLRDHLRGLLARSGRRYLGLCLSDVAGRQVACVRARGIEAGPPPAAAMGGVSRATPAAPLDTAGVRISAIDTLPPAELGGAPTQVLYYSVDLYDDVGARVGSLIVTVAAQPIFNLLIDPTGAARITIADRRGAYVLGPPGGSLGRDWPSAAPDILGGRAGTLMRPPDRPGSFVVFHDLAFPNQAAGTAWTVIYDLPLAAVLGPIDETLQANIALTVALLLGGLVAAYVLTRSIVRPMRELALAAERVGAGDLHAAIEVRSGDEIGALSRTLARTVEELRISIDSAEARRREAETLYATAVALSSTLDLHRVLDLILDELRAVVPYDSSTVQLLRGDRVEIIGAYGLAKPEQLIGMSFPLDGDEAPNGTVARTRAPLILDDAPSMYPHFAEEPFKDDPIRSWLGVPLIFGDRLIGMITVDKYEPGFYTPVHARLAGAFAAQAAIAIENARLYEAARDELAERRRSEQTQMRLSAILEATTDVVGSADTSGRLMFLNRAGRELLGIGEHEPIIGRPIFNYVPEEPMGQMLREAVPAAIRDGIWAGELTIRRRDGREIPASQVIIAHRNAEGHTEYFSTIVRDISERLRAEEQLRQAQKMEAVGRLAGGVSHDFNNILTVIMGECDLLLSDPGVAGEARQGLEQIRQAGARAAAMTRQLLAFSRRQVLQPATIDLNEIIAPTEKMLRRLIGEDIALRTCLAPDLAAVRADPSQIEQVILNLCINGRDAMPAGGELTISTENARLEAGGESGLAPGDYVRLVVHDNGAGIDEAARAHIFEPFFTTKPHGKGTGLGLATVHGIVQQSGGAISFSSAPGQGTSFVIYLPAAVDRRGAAWAADAAPRPIPPGTTVLLVEDDERVRRLVQQMLASRGLAVIEAADGVSARQLAERHAGQIDLLLSDIVMPGGLNGVQLAAQVRAARPTIKVLLMSGYTDNALAATGEVGLDTHFIQKPFTSAALLEKIAEALAEPDGRLLQRRA